MALGLYGYTIVNGYSIPVTANSLDETITPLVDEGVHGYGNTSTHGDAYSRLNYCIGAVTHEGQIGGSVFTGTGNASTAFKEMLRSAIIGGTSGTCRRNGLYIIGSPGGGAYTYRYPGLASDYPSIDPTLLKCLCDNFTINFTAGGIVTYTASYKAVGRSLVTTTPGNGSYSFEPTTPYTSIVANDDSNPLNWFQAPFRVFGASTGTEETYLNSGATITAWTLTIANNVVLEHASSGTNFPNIVDIGQMVITGSFTYFMPDADYSGNLKQSATIIIPFGGIKLVLGHIYINNAPVPMPGANAIVTRTVNFEAFAPGAGKSVTDPLSGYTYTSAEHDASLVTAGL